LGGRSGAVNGILRQTMSDRSESSHVVKAAQHGRDANGTRYHGVDGAESFLREWLSAWDEWDLRTEELLDAGEKVLAVVHQYGRSKSTGLVVDMSFAQVWTVLDGKQTRMEMYSDVDEALKAGGLE
jgi:ketosteroid isomerase-like protein